MALPSPPPRHPGACHSAAMRSRPRCAIRCPRPAKRGGRHHLARLGNHHLTQKYATALTHHSPRSAKLLNPPCCYRPPKHAARQPMRHTSCPRAALPNCLARKHPFKTALIIQCQCRNVLHVSAVGWYLVPVPRGHASAHPTPPLPIYGANPMPPPHVQKPPAQACALNGRMGDVHSRS